ncbi:Predicted dehydrogenase (MviM) (PDB:3UUW) [Commensalibacter communis]|uniref:Predicted dehydrogenase (MviM) n=1 Tax=Commensalibacter communis TaxID=2972786 RepID=A0A9W4XE87_9PROT|nr:Gfo/Idh/MocA family oxidoreductase [Commensalibacter communis]CAI3952269.1 Predicted dehydrogenase (MviM) (PDB:3UUW) [Commensalibacter communis]CAI3958566.1 Predicted dehydrogenase (MviM) (PDB:3UUW) [Commensalibacter communis]CAI3959768.1 Predicted dehydrogenase (MviM) (PDB:3UUW) [Commensalibacter communis]CAI3961473.1 Predicted dehydrogenase (MviM) (PDB:3UUW) [Commensalibacter communis]
MTRKKLNIGLIGSGFMGQAHADAYRRAALLYRNLKAEPILHTFADATPELAAEGASRFGFLHSTHDWKKLVTNPEIDLVDITTPNSMHFEMAMAAIEAGKHVYCEKPLTVNLEDAKALSEAAKKHGVKTMVGFNNIKTPSALLAKQLIDRGDIGQITRFRGWFDQGFFNDSDMPWSWRCSRKLAGTGSLGDLGAHVISVAQFLMGPIESVLGQEQTFFKTRPAPGDGSGYKASADLNAKRLDVENEDQFQSLVQFKNGAGGTIESSRIAAGKVFGVYWEISGTEGTIIMDGERFNELKIVRYQDDKADRGFKTVYAGSQVEQFNGFFGFDFAGGGLGYFDVKVIEIYDLIQGIMDSSSCFPDFDFGYENQKIIDAMAQSVSEKKRIFIKG